jgi:hypothetical protein
LARPPNNPDGAGSPELSRADHPAPPPASSSASDSRVRPTHAHVATFTDPEPYALETTRLVTGSAAPKFVGTVGRTFHAKTAGIILDRLGVGVGRASVPVAFTPGIPNAHVFVFATEPTAARRISGWTI